MLSRLFYIFVICIFLSFIGCEIPVPGGGSGGGKGGSGGGGQGNSSDASRGPTDKSKANPPTSTLNPKVVPKSDSTPKPKTIVAVGPPKLTLLFPTKGSKLGGTKLTIVGKDFISGATVFIGENVCENIAVTSSTKITCTTPPHSVGVIDVVVKNPDNQTSKLNSSFTYTFYSRIDLFAGTSNPSGFRDGVGKDTRFGGSSSLATDGTYLYVSDTSNHVIRKIDLSTNQVSTIAGLPGVQGHVNGIGDNARFKGPTGIVSDGTNLYVSDSGSLKLRKIQIDSTNVTTIAGAQGQPDAEAMRSLVLDDQKLNLYAVANHEIKKIGVAPVQITTVAGNNSQLCFHGVSTAGTGTGAAFCGGMGDLTFVNEKLYLANNYAIFQIDKANQFKTTLLAGNSDARQTQSTLDGIGISARFSTPMGITSDGTHLYVSESNYSDRGGHTIRKIVMNTAEVTTLVGKPGSAGYVDGIGSVARFRSPESLQYLNGNLYIFDAENFGIRKLTLNTLETSTIAGIGNGGEQGFANGSVTSARFQNISALAFDSSNLYIYDMGQKIRKINFQTGSVQVLVGKTNTYDCKDGISGGALINTGMVGMVSDGSYLYFADNYCAVIRKVNLGTGVVSILAGNPATKGSADGVGINVQFKSPVGIVKTGDFLYVTDDQTNTIRRIDVKDGTTITIAGNPTKAATIDGDGLNAAFYLPMYITTDGKNLYVWERFGEAIRKVAIDTAKVTTLVSNIKILSMTNDDTHLYIIESYPAHYLIKKIDMNTAEISTFLGDPNGTSIAEIDGPIESASVGYMSTVLFVKPNLFIGTNFGIRKVH